MNAAAHHQQRSALLVPIGVDLACSSGGGRLYTKRKSALLVAMGVGLAAARTGPDWLCPRPKSAFLVVMVCWTCFCFTHGRLDRYIHSRRARFFWRWCVVGLVFASCTGDWIAICTAEEHAIDGYGPRLLRGRVTWLYTQQRGRINFGDACGPCLKPTDG